MAVTIETAQGRRILIERSTATVGRDPACVVAFPDDARLLPQHAVLREVSGRWMIEAKGPLLPQIGHGLPARVHWLHPGDVIRLTPEGPELIFRTDSEAGAQETALAASQGEGPAVRQGPDARRSAIWAGAAVVVLSAILLAVFVWGNRPVRDGNAAVQNRPVGGEPVAASHNQAGAVGAPQGDRDEASTPVAEADIRRALYSVTVRAEDQGPVFQLGTACAISEHHLLTSAAVALALESLKDKLPAAAVSAPVLQQQFEVVGWTIHPQYRSAVADADRAQESAAASAEQLQEATEREAKRQLAGRIADAEQAQAEATGRQATYDVALLEVRDRLPATAPLAIGQEERLAVGSRAVLAGIAFAVKDYMVDPASPAMPGHSGAQIFAVPSVDQTAGAARRVVLKVSGDLTDQNWSGSPLVGASGKVIAVYSRPALPASPQASASGAHVASSVDRLEDFAEELVRPSSPE